MSEAAAALKNQSFDLFIIDLHFDESRMFEAIQLVRTFSKNAEKPVICIAQQAAQLHAPIKHSLEFTTSALGAWMFLDVHDHEDKPNLKTDLSRVIERALLGKARKATSKMRTDLHKQREDIHRLRVKIETEEWSDDVEEELVELRRNLAALLLTLCDVNIGNIAQQEQIDESRNLKDRVSDKAIEDEDKATQGERKQTLRELRHAVKEFEIAEREEEAAKKREENP